MVALVLAGCSGDHAVLSPKGPEAARTSALGWGMIVAATFVTVFVFGLLVAALVPGDRRRLRGLDDRVFLIGGGIVLPLVVIVVLSGATIWSTAATGRRGDEQIEVIGHQYWWEVRYRGSRAVTANEIHIPAGRRVRVTLRSDDVIHSFWVPALAGKIDMIPGRTNHLVIEADHPGTYRGQCAEFCGMQHARMAFEVIAQPPAAYQRWLQAQALPATADPGSIAGQQEFQQETCSGCHTIRGTEAVGKRGPDLTHVASRRTIAALTLANDPRHLKSWIADPQRYKSGALMPPSELTPAELTSITDYLAGLR